ncbi:ABC transporter ATP-binding protein [Streptosporangium pseudovulgare]|uniref:ABC transporter ATP-binding protein n=1 Tax=Streptosporangium pseudovulgare TaxID=35765 RepID=A0ABQ2RKX6_9ACTN|nr:ABC transporter ATP-binding protein [Streptosporangium pseudovulgare]GGQ33427.1 ABC transporter ATP-binding protein [Streptosporangium pseudovulgare]
MTLLLDEISVSVDGAALLRDLALTVGPRQIVGLIGPNGSGKTTALRCVYRALRPTGGVVRIDGRDLDRIPLRESARMIAALTQEGGSDLDFTVGEVVALGRTPHLRGNQALSATERELCRRAMAQTGIAHLAGRGVLSLSGGERQRVLVARALVQEPRVLILDEPTNHLDLHHQLRLLSMLKESGLSVLVTLHDLNLAASACDRLAVLSRGSLVSCGPPAEVLTEALLRDVFGVAASIVPHPLTGVPQVLYNLGSTPTAKGNPA